MLPTNPIPQGSHVGELHGWNLWIGVTCVECPQCGFTFDACHTNTDGTNYSCPMCDDGKTDENWCCTTTCDHAAGVYHCEPGTADLVRALSELRDAYADHLDRWCAGQGAGTRHLPLVKADELLRRIDGEDAT